MHKYGRNTRMLKEKQHTKDRYKRVHTEFFALLPTWATRGQIWTDRKRRK